MAAMSQPSGVLLLCLLAAGAAAAQAQLGDSVVLDADQLQQLQQVANQMLQQPGQGNRRLLMSSVPSFELEDSFGLGGGTAMGVGVGARSLLAFSSVASVQSLASSTKRERREGRREGRSKGHGKGRDEEPAEDRVHGPVCTHGRIAEIKCWLDSKGYVTGIAFEDDTGGQPPSICKADGEPQDGGVLQDGESVVEVIACKGPKGGYQYIEFHTDGGRRRPITCGWGHDSSMQLKGLGSVQQCESLSNFLTPKWSSAPDAAVKWYEEVGYTPTHFPYGGKSFAKAGALDPMTGRRAGDLDVPPYYKEVFPLADLKGRCNKKGELAVLENACWNNEYKPNRKRHLVVAMMTAELDRQEDDLSEPECPGPYAIEGLRRWSLGALQHILSKEDCDAEIKGAVLNCKPQDDTHNTTLSVIATVDGRNKKSVREIEESLSRWSTKYEDNLCDARGRPGRTAPQTACSRHSVYSLDYYVKDKPMLPRGVQMTDRSGHAIQ